MSVVIVAIIVVAAASAMVLLLWPGSKPAPQVRVTTVEVLPQAGYAQHVIVNGDGADASASCDKDTTTVRLLPGGKLMDNDVQITTVADDNGVTVSFVGVSTAYSAIINGQMPASLDGDAAKVFGGNSLSLHFATANFGHIERVALCAGGQ